MNNPIAAALLIALTLGGTAAAQFAPATNYACTNPPKLDAGDLDGDGLIDLITGSTAPACYAYLNTGGGAFAPAIPLTQPGPPRDVKTADFDGANALDYVTVVSSTQIAVHLSSGAFPAYAPATLYTVAAIALEVEVSDVDLDGDVDIAVLSQSSPGEISIFTNLGGGVFTTTPMVLALTQVPTGFAAGNVSSRWGEDFIYCTGFDSVGVVVNTSTSPLTYAPNVFFPVASRPTAVVAADFNGDGHKDLATSNGGVGTAASVLINEGACASGWWSTVNFLPFVTYAVAGTDNQNFGIATEDFDCDGDLDLVLANRNAALIGVLFNDGAGTFGGSVTFPTGPSCTDVVAAHFGGILPDVATANQVDISVLNNNLPETFCDHVFIGGIRDGFVNPLPATVENVCTGAELDVMLGTWPRSNFDQNSCDRHFGHTFSGLPGNMLSATLEIRIRAQCGGAANDGFRIGVDGVCGVYSYSTTCAAVTGSAWGTGSTATLTFDLENLPSGLDLLRKMQTDGRLDIALQDDTVVDYALLRVTTCGPLRETKNYSHTPFVAFNLVTMTCAAEPGAIVLFYVDLGVGPGPALPPWGGFCLPAPGYLSWGAESGGVATLTFPMPSLPPCLTLSTQALHVVPVPFWLKWSNTMTQQCFL